MMSTTTELEKGRVNRREFVQRFARRAGLTPRVAQQAYDAMVAELTELVGNGYRVTLTGFGKFYPQKHKGHQVRVPGGGPSLGSVDDYHVLRFSATRAVNQKLDGKRDPD